MSPEVDLREQMRPQLIAIIKFAERLDMKSASDENAQQIMIAARGLLDVINQESVGPRDGGDAALPESNERCDVLHIEDDSITFTAVKLLLETKRRLKVVHATSGETGLVLARTQNPKLILLDLDLPGIHGSEVIQHLQKDPLTARIPVVVMSGDATPSQIERLLVLGARNYLTKPFETEPFLAVVDDVMQKSAPGRAV